MLRTVGRSVGLFSTVIGTVAVTFGAGFARAEDASAVGADYAAMSIEDLAEVQISSVSKRPESLSQAAAAIYVITNEDIRRSGATSIPEMLRLAPNLEVAQINARSYSVTARGFGSASPNKLLVLIDGRAVYSPLHAAVFWDAQQVMAEDVDLIEVISGPGGTLWGVNAVNGVINIITRSASDTQGVAASVGTGNQESDFAARYGGSIGESLNYRLHVEGFDRLRTFTAAGPSARDGWRGIQGGFRVDWRDTADFLTLQGDFYGVAIDAGNSALDGQNVLGRWTHSWTGGGESEVQAYWDRANRFTPGSIGDVVNTYDIDLRHSLQVGKAHDLVVGGGYRRADGFFTNTPAVFILPAGRRLEWLNAFVQDTIALAPQWRLTAGAKYEHSSYSGSAFMPSVRLSWSPSDSTMLWAAISRAERGPSQLDRDFHQSSGRIAVVVAGNFQPEKLWAYELGYRTQLSRRVSLSVSTFYNDYSDLRSTELSPAGGLPATFGNVMEGHTYGVETWGTFGLTDWWRLSAGFTALHKSLHFKPGSRDVSGLQAAGNDPGQWATLRSSISIGRALELDIDLREVGALPTPRVPAYGTLDARIGWHVTDHLDFSVRGTNLLNQRHVEFGAFPARSQIPRAIYASFQWRT